MTPKKPHEKPALCKYLKSENLLEIYFDIQI